MSFQSVVEARKISALVHFTRLNNLAGIVQHGLLPRNACMVGNVGAVINDPYRNDHTDAVCATVTTPNYKTFFMMRQNNPGVEWVVVAIRPEALWLRDCAFCNTNAAFGEVTAIPIAQRKGVEAFKGMFAERGKTLRAVLDIPASFTTDPQAEVLILDGVPTNLLMCLIVETDTMKQKLTAAYPHIKIITSSSYFRPRKDYRYWKKDNG